MCMRVDIPEFALMCRVWWVGLFRVMTLRDSFHCCFTVRSFAASTAVSLLIVQRLLLSLSPTIHEDRATVE